MYYTRLRRPEAWRSPRPRASQPGCGRRRAPWVPRGAITLTPPSPAGLRDRV